MHKWFEVVMVDPFHSPAAKCLLRRSHRAQ